jgi:uncharacterized protein (TIGR03437 family)
MTAGVLAVFLATHMGFGQQTTPSVAGIWQVSVDVGWSATIEITQNGTQLVGQFTPVANPTPAFTATIVAPEAGLDLILTWDTSRAGIPGTNVPTLNGVTNIYGYWGSISSDGASIQGTYGISPSQSVGTWTAKLLAGLGPSISGVTNAASGATGPIAPGEIISMFANPATNPIGPTDGVGLQLDQSGKVATTLGGVKVHFLPIDVNAPLTFVGAGQINAVVPYEVAGLTSVNVQVQYSDQTSPPVELQVAPTAPGIFTANGSGVGPGAIFNQDGVTLNGPNHPEPRGGYVVVFATGEGQTNPPGVSGAVTTVAAAPPLTPAPLASVKVLINGQLAATSFLGEAPSLVSGVLQLNVQVPLTVSPGNVPIQIIIGGNGSQNGVTVTVQ